MAIPAHQIPRLTWSLATLLVACCLFVSGCGDEREATETLAVPAPPADTLLGPDLGAAIREWVLFLGDDHFGAFLDTHCDLILKSPPETLLRIVHSAPGARAHLENLLRKRGFDAFQRIRWRQSPKRISYWTRDMCVVGMNVKGRPVCFLPHRDHYGLILPEPLSGEAVRSELTHLFGSRILETAARIEGGAVVADEERAFITPDAEVLALLNQDFPTRSGIHDYLSGLFGLPVEVVTTRKGLPGNHLDLFMTPAGPRRMILGDPTLAVRMLSGMSEVDRGAFEEDVCEILRGAPEDDSELGGDNLFLRLIGGNEAPDLLAAFRSTLAQLEGLGYEVHRVPYLSLRLGDTEGPITFSWNNVVQEIRRGRPRVYLPTYRLPALDEAASKVYADLGYEVIPIDCLGPALYGGAIRCLSQVLRVPPLWTTRPLPE
jgi:hypothetical protein